MDVIAYAIPVFFALIGVELLAAHVLKRRVYRFSDAIVDLSCGTTQQATKVLLSGFLVLGYTAIYTHGRLLDLAADSVWTWLLAFVLVDLIYYWWHRLSHEVNVLWAGHIVHHQSEDYNLAVALRQSSFTSLSSWLFYLPLAVLGIPPLVFFVTSIASTLYQFWIHSELIPRLGPLEWVLNTASHHRVHHAVNPHYLDKNYGATLIVWDRLFGTFEPEGEAPVYGLVKPLQSFNPAWAQVHHFVYLARTAWQAPGWDKLRIFFKPPAWRPAGFEPYPPPPAVAPDRFVKYQPPASAAVKLYVVVQFVLVALGLVALLLHSATIGVGVKLCGVAAIVASTAVWGGLFEGKRWTLAVEALRLLLVLAALGLALPGRAATLLPGLAVLAGLDLVWCGSLTRGRRAQVAEAAAA